MSQQYPPARDKSGYLSSDTIVALSTAPGGAIAIVRASGPLATRAVASLSDAHERFEKTPLRTLTRLRLRDPEGGELLDDALCVRFAAPDSYTGEDLVELHLHGSPFIAARTLECLVLAGARQALPGEFSFRAVRNGKISLTEAQAIADLIAAGNAQAVSLALEKMAGSQMQLLTGVAEALRRLAALSELGIDFSDQDLDEVSLPRIREQLRAPIDALRKLESSFDRGVRLQHGVKAAFLGLPNAGKSSFFNALLGEERSIVTEFPGTTRDVVRERLTLRSQLGSVTLLLEDTAGLRASEDHVEKIGIARSQRAAKEADLVIFLVDPTSPVGPALEQWRSLGVSSQRAIGLLTKSDLRPKEMLSSFSSALAPFDIPRWTDVSVTAGRGVSEAIDLIVETCSRWTKRGPEEVLLTRLDQVTSVREALSHLERGLGAPELSLLAADIRQALHALGPLVGETRADDILGQIFSEFCIGK